MSIIDNPGVFGVRCRGTRYAHDGITRCCHDAGHDGHCHYEAPVSEKTEKAKRAQEIADRIAARGGHLGTIGCSAIIDEVVLFEHTFDPPLVFGFESALNPCTHGVANEHTVFCSLCGAKVWAFTTFEEWNIKDYGSRCYTERAADVAQVKVLRAELEAQEEAERGRLACAEHWEWKTDSDLMGVSATLSAA